MPVSFHFGRLELVLDKTQVFPDDPGAGTPALVVVNQGHQSSSGTYMCVKDQGETVDGCQLSARELDWLDSMEGQVEDILYG